MRTIKEYEKCLLHSVKYKGTSTAGNPSYWVVFWGADGEYHRGCTGCNWTAGYTIQNYQRRASGTVIYLRYHVTKKGACVITGIQHNSPAEATKNFFKETLDIMLNWV